MSPQPPKPQTNGVHRFEKPLFGAVPCVRDPTRPYREVEDAGLRIECKGLGFRG